MTPMSNVNAKRKGTTNERKLREAYQRAGFWLYSPNNSMYGDNDLFNLFDMVAFCPRTGVMHYTQCKTNRVERINAWFHDASPLEVPGVRCVRYAVRHDQTGWRLAGPTQNGYEWLYDGRDTEHCIGEGLTQYLKGE